MNAEPPKPPIATDDLKRIRAGISSLSATGHIAVGMLSWLVASAYVNSSRELIVTGVAFVVVGAIQKILALNDWRR